MSSRGQRKEKTPTTLNPVEGNNTITRSIARAQPDDLDSTNASFDKLVEALEIRLLAKITDLVERVEERISTKIENSIQLINNKILECESSITKLQQCNSHLQAQIEDILRSQRLNDVVVRGIPIMDKENVLQVVKNIASVLEFPTSPYVDAFRIAAKSQSSSQGLRANAPIIIRFSSNLEQKAFLHAFRKRRGIQLCDLEGFSSSSRIYVNESLTPLNNKLLREALKHRKLGKICSVLTRNGFLYVRRNEGDNEVKVKSQEQLNNLLTH